MVEISQSQFLDEYQRFLQTVNNKKDGSVFLTFKRYEFKEKDITIEGKRRENAKPADEAEAEFVCLAHVKLGEKDFSCAVRASEAVRFADQFNTIYRMSTASLVPPGGESERLKKRREASKKGANAQAPPTKASATSTTSKTSTSSKKK